MADPEHLKLLAQGSIAWNEWRNQNPVPLDLSKANFAGKDFSGGELGPPFDLRRVNLSEADLSGANLTGVRLVESDLGMANLTNANLSGADLTDAHLTHARLVSANLDRANLEGANVAFADLEGAQLVRANLVFTSLHGASLVGASIELSHFVGASLPDVNLEGAQMGGTVLASIELSRVKGLDTVVHFGPSEIGIETLLWGQGKIPAGFLRGAGFPDTIIKFAASLGTSNFFSCFISFSSKDQRFASGLYTDLQAKGIRCWLFPEDAKWGEPMWSEIDRATKGFDRLIVICSKHSLQSQPVLREVERALQREDKEKRNVLFPIRIDDYLLNEWEHPRKADVVNKVLADFRDWKNPAAYQNALNRLVEALSKGGSGATT